MLIVGVPPYKVGPRALQELAVQDPANEDVFEFGDVPGEVGEGVERLKIRLELRDVEGWVHLNVARQSNFEGHGINFLGDLVWSDELWGEGTVFSERELRSVQVPGGE